MTNIVANPYGYSEWHGMMLIAGGSFTINFML